MKVFARPVAALGSYNATAAVDYAHWWANAGPRTGAGYNPAYTSFSQDCANFMSQSLAAGGWTAKGGFYLDPSVWWYDSNGPSNSNTWSVADWLAQFDTNSGRSYAVGAFTDLQLGDLMFADWAFNGTSGTPEHSMMVTYKTSNNYADIRFSYPPCPVHVELSVRIPRPALIVVLAVGTLAAAAILLRGPREYRAAVQEYRLTDDPLTIVVHASLAPGDTVVGGEAREAGSTITVIVRALDVSSASGGQGESHFVPVRLHSAVADRTVVDGSDLPGRGGQVVPRAP